MSENVVNTLVVNFGESASSSSGALSVEWDDILNVDDKGEVKSNIFPGDQVYFLESHEPGINIVAVKTTSGSVSNIGPVTLDREQELSWGDTDESQNLRYSPRGSLKYNWFGRVGSGAPSSGRELKLTGNFPCLALVKYGVLFNRYLLHTQQMSLAKDETFPFKVYVYYTEAAT